MTLPWTMCLDLMHDDVYLQRQRWVADEQHRRPRLFLDGHAGRLGASLTRLHGLHTSIDHLAKWDAPQSSQRGLEAAVCPRANVGAPGTQV